MAGLLGLFKDRSSSRVSGRSTTDLSDLAGGERVLTIVPTASSRKPTEPERLQVVQPEAVMREPALPPQVTAYLGERLRADYSHLVNDPIPDELIQILEALDQKRGLGHGR
jgi:Anti-sigma factor NepR